MNHKEEKHQKYLGTFSHFILESEYLDAITKFILDPLLSPHNEDDIELFQKLLFNNPNKKYHIYYYLSLLKDINNSNIDWKTRILANYIKYLNQISNLYLTDLYDYILSMNNNNFLNILLKRLDPVFKLQLAQYYAKHYDFLPHHNKLRIYHIFHE